MKKAAEVPIPYRVGKMKDMAMQERPQERMETYGAGSLTDTELLAMLLRSGTQGVNVMSLASHLLMESGGQLHHLARWSEADFRRVKGMGKVKALQLVAVMEIARRCSMEGPDQSPVLDEPQKVFQHFRPISQALAVEKFWVCCLNRKNRLIKRVEVTSGTASSSLVHPREVFREAIRLSASAVICAHNHPSGDPAPSSADIQITRQLREAARVLAIDLLDHVIVGREATDPTGQGFYSFRESGLL